MAVGAVKNFAMDYDSYYDDEPDKRWILAGFGGWKVFDGKISLKNAINRLKFHELYVLVTYQPNEELPEQYRPLNDLHSDDGTLFATLRYGRKWLVSDLCSTRVGMGMGVGIQGLSELSPPDAEDREYMLGPGSDFINLSDMYMDQYEAFYGQYRGSSKGNKRL